MIGPSPENSLLQTKHSATSMAHDVFISHSSKDKPTADAICAALESTNIRCWVAPRDISPGANWGESIIDGITNSKVMVVVFSSHANKSAQVMREIERAVNKGLPIIPMRIEDVLPSKSLEYFLSVPHWLDALTPPLQAHVTKLCRTVKTVLETVDPKPAAEPPIQKLHTHPQPLVGSPGKEAPPDEWFSPDSGGLWSRILKFLTRE